MGLPPRGALQLQMHKANALHSIANAFVMKTSGQEIPSQPTPTILPPPSFTQESDWSSDDEDEQNSEEEKEENRNGSEATPEDNWRDNQGRRGARLADPIEKPNATLSLFNCFSFNSSKLIDSNQGGDPCTSSVVPPWDIEERVECLFFGLGNSPVLRQQAKKKKVHHLVANDRPKDGICSWTIRWTVHCRFVAFESHNYRIVLLTSYAPGFSCMSKWYESLRLETLSTQLPFRPLWRTYPAHGIVPIHCISLYRGDWLPKPCLLL